MRLITDLDLHDSRIMLAVSDNLANDENVFSPPGVRWEMWLRDAGAGNELALVRSWVDHERKRVALVTPSVEVEAEEEMREKRQGADDRKS